MANKKIRDPIDVHIGKRVKVRRKILAITQEELAAKVGVKFQQVQKYEGGTNRMTPRRLLQVANALEVPISFFFEGIPNGGGERDAQPFPGFISEILATSDGIKLARGFASLPTTKLRRIVIDLVEQLTSNRI